MSALAGTAQSLRSIFLLQTIFRPIGLKPIQPRFQASNPSNLRAQGKNMFDSSTIIVGLEIGTSKICAVVGEVNDTGVLNIVGIGQAKSRGVRKGEIADNSLAEEDIRNAIAEAE